MAKKSAVERNDKRIRMVANQAKKRAELKKKALDESLSDEDRMAARFKLQKMPRNGAACRVKTRCSVTGRPRGVYRKFGISRIAFREMALKGQLPGVIKASW